MIDTVYRNCGQKETVIFCDRIMALGFREAFKAGISFGKDDMVVPESKPRFIAETSALAKEYEQQYNDGLITQGEKYNKVVDAWAKCSDKLAEEMMAGISAVRKDKTRPRHADQLDLHDVAFGRARFADADAPARRYARPDGEALGRNHREPDHLQLQGGAVGSRILQLDPRRAQGPRRHRAEDREFGLPDAPSGRRRAGFDHHHARLRLDRRHQDARDHRRRHGRRLARLAHSRPHRGRDAAGRRRQGDRPRRPHDRRRGHAGDQRGGHPGSEDSLRADLRGAQRRLRGLLRARSGARHAGQHGRGGGRHRRPVDRRAGHAAHHAHLPHRRRGAVGGSVVHRIEFRRRSEDPQPQPVAQLQRRSDGDGAQRRDRRLSIAAGPSALSIACNTARASRSTTATRSSAASASPNGTRSPGRSSPRSTASSASRT